MKCRGLIEPRNTGLESSDIFRKVSSLIRKDGYIELCSIIVENDTEPELPPTFDKFSVYEIKNCTNLGDILNDLLAVEVKGEIILQACVPKTKFLSHQNGGNNCLYFDSSERTIEMLLNKDAYQICPDLSHFEGISIKRLADSKKGHGSGKFATYITRIKISIQDSLSSLNQELVHLINSVFNNFCVKLHTYDFQKDVIYKIMGHLEIVDTYIDPKINLLNNNRMQIPEKNFQGNETAYYEALTLCHIDSSLIDTQPDFSLSSFEAPNLEKCSKPLYRVFCQEIHGMCFKSIYEKIDWRSLSIKTKSSHILIYRDIDNSVLWCA